MVTVNTNCKRHRLNGIDRFSFQDRSVSVLFLMLFWPSNPSDMKGELYKSSLQETLND